MCFDMFVSRAINKYFLVHGVKLKAKALQHFEVDPVMKMNATFLNRLDQCKKKKKKGGE